MHSWEAALLCLSTRVFSLQSECRLTAMFLTVEDFVNFLTTRSLMGSPSATIPAFRFARRTFA